MDARIVRVSQSLFVRPGRDGGTWEFASLDDGGCVLLRDRHVVAVGGASHEAVDRLMEEFLRQTGHASPQPAFRGNDDLADPQTTHRAA